MLRTVFFLTLLSVLFYALFQSAPPPQLFPDSDKVGHLLGFAMVTTAGLFLLPKKLIGYFITMMVLLAAGSELIQGSFLPRRYFSIWDLYANLAGVLSVVLPWSIFKLTCRRSSALPTFEE